MTAAFEFQHQSFQIPSLVRGVQVAIALLYEEFNPRIEFDPIGLSWLLASTRSSTAGC